MRVFLAILMTVAQIAGPWLCCCGPVRAAASQASAKAPPPVTDDTCPHCKEHTPPPPVQPKDPPKAPDRCPCGGVLVMSAPADKPELPKLDSLLVVVTVEPPQTIPLVSASPRAVCGLREVPHLTAEDRLFAHHVLRC